MLVVCYGDGRVDFVGNALLDLTSDDGFELLEEVEELLLVRGPPPSLAAFEVVEGKGLLGVVDVPHSDFVLRPTVHVVVFVDDEVLVVNELLEFQQLRVLVHLHETVQLLRHHSLLVKRKLALARYRVTQVSDELQSHLVVLQSFHENLVVLTSVLQQLLDVALIVRNSSLQPLDKFLRLFYLCLVDALLAPCPLALCRNVRLALLRVR